MAGRELSAHTVMFHTAVAERLRLGLTDHKAFDFILRQGAVTAGQLAEITGLTTGAITGVIDRLEETGYVERVRDAADRRKVLVRPALSPARERQCCQLFDSLGKSVDKVASGYSDRELSVILDFMRRSVEVMRAETQKLGGGRDE
jgi:DNA-binding MarR family transcriptional regulator